MNGFKELLDANNVEYHFYENENVFSINFENAEDKKTIRDEINKLCEMYGFLNGVKLNGRAVIEVSNDTNAIKELGFESEPYLI